MAERKLPQAKVEEFLQFVTGVFTLRDMWGELGIDSEENKAYLRVIMRRLAGAGIIESTGKDGTYRKKNTTIDKIDWVSANPDDILPLRWPKGGDGTSFKFENMKVYPKTIIVVSGQSNLGKTVTMLNFLVENMDDFPCLYMSNELGAEELAGRLRYFDWVSLVKDDGSPKFESIERDADHEDILLPDGVNIIDYLDPGEDFYKAGPMIGRIWSKLNRGIAIIALQKGGRRYYSKKDGQMHYSPNEYGVGGHSTESRARFVLHIDKTDQGNSLFIKKAKSWQKENPNGKRFLFDISQHGAMITNIREIADDVY